MERLGVPSPHQDNDDAPPKVANNSGPNVHRGSLPMTPVNSALLSPYYPQIQIPTVNPHTPPATIGTPSAYQQSEGDSEGDGQESPAGNGEDVGASPRSESTGQLATPRRKNSWARPETQPEPNLNTDIARIATGSAVTDASQTRGRSISASSINSLASWSSPVINTPLQRLKGGKGVDLDPPPSLDALKRPQSPAPYVQSSPNLHLTIDTGGDSSSQDTTFSPQLPFPQITVSDWGKGEEPTSSNALLLTPLSIETLSDASNTVDGGILGKDPQLQTPRRDNGGPSRTAGRHESGAAFDSVGNTMSLQDLETRQEAQERNRAIEKWLESPLINHPYVDDGTNQSEDDNVPSKDIALGHHTKNIVVPGQLYYNHEGHHFTEQDLALMKKRRSWDDSPIFSTITQPDIPLQPPSSNAAMELFQKMCHETGSAVSSEASCGTRRGSLQSSGGLYELNMGNFLFKKDITSTPPDTEILIARFIIQGTSNTNPRKRSGVEGDDASVKEDIEDPPVKKIRGWDDGAAANPDISKPRSIEMVDAEKTEVKDCESDSCDCCRPKRTLCNQKMSSCIVCTETGMPCVRHNSLEVTDVTHK